MWLNFTCFRWQSYSCTFLSHNVWVNAPLNDIALEIEAWKSSYFSNNGIQNLMLHYHYPLGVLSSDEWNAWFPARAALQSKVLPPSISWARSLAKKVPSSYFSAFSTFSRRDLRFTWRDDVMRKAHSELPDKKASIVYSLPFSLQKSFEAM